MARKRLTKTPTPEEHEEKYKISKIRVKKWSVYAVFSTSMVVLVLYIIANALKLPTWINIDGINQLATTYGLVIFGAIIGFVFQFLIKE